jgi:hypothetical protein
VVKQSIRKHSIHDSIGQGQRIDIAGFKLDVVDPLLASECPGLFDLSRITVDPRHIAGGNLLGQIDGDRAGATATIQQTHPWP